MGRLGTAISGGPLVNPRLYTLTTRDGVEYRYDQFDGLQRITDRNGNTVTFTETGIEHSSGESIEFVRDHRGRISEVIDPAGSSIQYEYDLAGDLVKVTNQVGLEYTLRVSGSTGSLPRRSLRLTGPPSLEGRV